MNPDLAIRSISLRALDNVEAHQPASVFLVNAHSNSCLDVPDSNFNLTRISAPALPEAEAGIK